MALDLFGETVEIILGTTSLPTAPLGLLEVHNTAHYRPFQLATGGRFQFEKEVLALESTI
jgi:hypothetical protein